MAQFDYLGSWQDSQGIVGGLLRRPGTRLLVDDWYTKPIPTCIDVPPRDARQLVQEWRSIFITGADFSPFPPQFSKVENGEVLYRIRGNEGGPCLRLTLPACYEQDGMIYLAHGMFYYYREYLNPNTKAWEPPSPEVKAAYKEILRLIKQHLVRHKFHTPIWIGRDALRLLQEDKARITGFGLDSPKTYAELREAL